MSDDQLITVEEVAEMLRISKNKVAGLAKSKAISSIKISERCTRYSRNSVQGFINSASK